MKTSTIGFIAAVLMFISAAFQFFMGHYLLAIVVFVWSVYALAHARELYDRGW